jgi:hypothetical protein
MEDVVKEGIISAMNNGNWDKNSGSSLLVNLGLFFRKRHRTDIAKLIWYDALRDATDDARAALAYNYFSAAISEAIPALELAIQQTLPIPDASYPTEVKERIIDQNEQTKVEWDKKLELAKRLLE